MEIFTRLIAVAMPMDAVNLDTDQLIPARFLRKPLDDNYHRYLFCDLLFNQDGSEKLNFIYNQTSHREARFIVGNRNFCCGSSRGAAVYALVACDFRAVIAPSFGDIVFNSCSKNGVLPICLDDETVAKLRRQLKENPGAVMTVDLETQEFTGPDALSF
ncbi:MAG: 3-isopropylmalate dehydratase small subunit [Candidatus Binatia bacterium]|jgi:3-isopropylmalate/(R)-2-methylmalate dehydratase small subunit|nr:3-isopropylmalate dehydratase small subunit [Candidatus Binatia bacterium]